MFSQKANDYIFTFGEYTGRKPSDMLNQYLVVQYMEFLLRCDWFEDKKVIQELVDYAHKYKTHLGK